MSGNSTASAISSNNAGGSSFSQSFAPTASSSSFFAPTTSVSLTTTFSTADASSSPSSFPFSENVSSTSSSAASTSSSFAAPTTSSQSVISSSVVVTPATSGGSSGTQPTTVIITSTAPTSTPAPVTTKPTSTTSVTSATSSAPAALETTGASASGSKGLSAGGKIAVAVVVPVAAVALIVLLLLFWWRRRKQRKDAEELRRKEVEEYGFNPNADPTLPAVAGASANGDDPEMKESDNSGYRGWGATPVSRKLSTNMQSGSGNGTIGMARSDSGSNPGGYHAVSPGAGTAVGSDVQSNDPLMDSPNKGRPTTADSETIGALGAAPAAAGARTDRGVNRGPSNASSAYSGAQRSEGSGEGPPPGTAIGSPQHYNENMYYDEAIPQHGPYGDGSYGGGAQPVIRDVQARRNTRIENPKFGKHLQKRQLDVPEYAASFVNYKALKKLIKQLSLTPTLSAQNASNPTLEVIDPQTSLQANKAKFFFRLERELEKVNVFYLQKEAELKLRLKTLLDKKRMMQSRNSTASKISASFITLEEGFQQFGNDLNKLQQFVEINATAFSKILKKWDKTSKSRTKELYLSRAVEVQPCFNREIISDLSDQATTSLLELGAWAEGENLQYSSGRPAEYTISGQAVGTDDNDTDSQILQAANTCNLSALNDWISRLRGSPDARGRFTRSFLAAITEAPVQALEALLSTDLVDAHAEDEINERNCLHEAAICGREAVLNIGISRGVDVGRVDVYGRIPLHYACMHGHVDMVRILLARSADTINALDHDNFTPLIHGIVRHQLGCVKELLSHGARIDPESDADHVPLNLACQHGSLAITELLLEKNAKTLPDAEGLFPQHLVARTGRTPETLLMLERYGADLDQRDKLYQWTPLFHAASDGRVECMKILLARNVDIDILDEKQLSAMYYATWEGHLQCMKLLSEAGAGSGLVGPSTSSQTIRSSPLEHSTTADATRVNPDSIPDLSLPPPIIPMRRYGHNFLDTKTFVQISFEEAGRDAVMFYNDSKYPAARLTISSKLSDLIPRNIMLPIQEDFKIISFQIDNLDSFAVDFDIFPTFGSKIIAKSVALPNIFSAISSGSGHCCLPLFDPRLRAIGQISFNFQVIKPFHGIPLEITQFETYWKATSQFDTHPNTLITGSSLSGEYVQLFVQLTSDAVPVLYPKWSINHYGIDFPIARLTYDQFLSLGSRSHQVDEPLAKLSQKTSADIAEIHGILASSFVTLRNVFAYLPTGIHINIHILYPTATEEKALGIGPTLNINNFVDAILKDVFAHARVTRDQSPDFMRSIVFSSYNPDICTALNWKQPNYPVLLCNDLGAKRDGSNTTTAVIESSGHGSMSVKEAVRIAQSNNFMGLICSSKLFSMVPTLIESIKVAGLVLVIDTSEDPTISQETAGARSYRMPDGIDGILRGNGVLRFNETIDM